MCWDGGSQAYRSADSDELNWYCCNIYIIYLIWHHFHLLKPLKDDFTLMNVPALPSRLFDIVHRGGAPPKTFRIGGNQSCEKSNSLSPLPSNAFTSSTCPLHLPPPLSVENRKPQLWTKQLPSVQTGDGKSSALSLPELKKTVDRLYSSLWLRVITGKEKKTVGKTSGW